MKRPRTPSFTHNIRVLVAASSLALIAFGCGQEGTNIRAAATTEPTSPSRCEGILIFEPTYLPAGLQQVEAGPRQPGSAWNKAWADGGARVEVVGGISADHGDDPTIRDVEVRDHPAQLVAGDRGSLTVDWYEPKFGDPCAVQYAIFSSGLSEGEVLRIGDSLEER